MQSILYHVTFVVLSLIFLAGCGSDSNEESINAIEVSSESLQIRTGLKTQLTAKAILTSGEIKEVTNTVIWKSSDTAIARVSETGELEAISSGSVSISAVFQGESSNNLLIAITNVGFSKVVLTAAEFSIAKDTQTVFEVNAYYEDGSIETITEQANVLLSNNVFRLSDNNLSAQEIGEAVIYAEFGGIQSNPVTFESKDTQLTSLVISSAKENLLVGTSSVLQAIGYFSDDSQQSLTDSVNWTMTNSNIHYQDDLNNNHSVVALSPGRSVITANYGNISSYPINVNIESSTLIDLSITLNKARLKLGQATKYTVLARYANGQQVDVSDNAVVLPSSNVLRIENNKVITESEGTANLIARFGELTSSAAPLNIENSPISSISLDMPNSFLKGEKVSPTVSVIYDDGEKSALPANVLEWIIDDLSVANMDINQQLIARNEGDTSIRAIFKDYRSPSANISIRTATLENIEIFSTKTQLKTNNIGQLSAVAHYSSDITKDITGQVSWQLSQPILSINSDAAFVAESTGQTKVSASFKGFSSSAITISVAEATLTQIFMVRDVVDEDYSVTLQYQSQDSNAMDLLPQGIPVQYNAIGLYSDGSFSNISKEVDWLFINSNNSETTRLSFDNGIIEGMNLGEGTIKIQYLDVESVEQSIKVVEAEIESITLVTPSNTLSLDSAVNVALYAKLTDNSFYNITDKASWFSDVHDAININKDIITGDNIGTTEIWASMGGFTSNREQITVFDSPITTLTLSSGTDFVLGEATPLVVQALFENGNTQNITTSVYWSISNQDIVKISPSNVLFPVSEGQTEIQASIVLSEASPYIQIFTVNSYVSTVNLTSIQITPAQSDIAIDTHIQYVALGIYDDGSYQDISNDVIWLSSNTTAATINASGQGLGSHVGNTTILATLMGLTSNTSALFVYDNELVSIQVTADHNDLSIGLTQQYQALATYANGHVQNITNEVTWQVSDPTLASIDETGQLTTLFEGEITVSASYADITSNMPSLEIHGEALISLQITPNTLTLSAGTTHQYIATGYYNDGHTLDLTNAVAWTVNNAIIAGVDNTGLFIANTAGSASVTAHFSDISSNVSSVNVHAQTLTSIQITPADDTINIGLGTQYTAIGTYDNDVTQNITHSVTWSSSDTNLATINFNGYSTGVAEGNITINARFSNISSNPATLTINAAPFAGIVVTPNNSNIAVGGKLQFTATGYYLDASVSNLTDHVSWHVEDSSIATVGELGVITALSAGTTTVAATYDGISYSQSLTVSAKTLSNLVLTPNAPNMATLTTLQLTATGYYSDNSTEDLTHQVNWNSDNTSKATVSNQGLITANTIGVVNIIANYQSFTKSQAVNVTTATLTSLVLTPNAASITQGTTLQYTATGYYSDFTSVDLTSLVSWTSNHTSVATVTEDGLAAGIDLGSVVLTATLGAINVSNTLSVTDAKLNTLVVSPNITTLARGEEQQYLATGYYLDSSVNDLTSLVSWVSNAPTVATVNSTGLVSALNAGTAIIYSSYQDKITAHNLTVSSALLESISVAPNNMTMGLNSTTQYTATGYYSDGNTADLSTVVSWQSSNPSVATINSDGIASSDSAGSILITASHNGLTQSQTLTVTAATLDSLIVTPSDESIALGNNLQYTATGYYSDGSTENLSSLVNWQSSDVTVATINTNGLAKGLTPGVATIRASYGDKNNSQTLTVTSASLVSLITIPNLQTLIAGNQHQFYAIGYYSDDSIVDITESVNWLSNDVSIASVSNSENSKGITAALQTGSTNISAQDPLSNLTSNSVITVSAATLDSIVLSESSSSIAAGNTVQLTAMGHYSDNTQVLITDAVSWQSDNTLSATVNSDGLVTTIAAGSVNLTATHEDQHAQITLIISSATLTNIQITPNTPSIAAGNNIALSATAYYSDGSTTDITMLASWQSSITSIATINTQGIASSLLSGTTNISASYQGLHDEQALSVSAAILESIVVSPETESIRIEGTLQYTATGHYSDNSINDLTTHQDINWSTNDTAIASIGQQNGLLTGITIGDVIVTATLDSFSDSQSAIIISAENELAYYPDYPEYRDPSYAYYEIGDNTRYSSINYDWLVLPFQGSVDVNDNEITLNLTTHATTAIYYRQNPLDNTYQLYVRKTNSNWYGFNHITVNPATLSLDNELIHAYTNSTELNENQELLNSYNSDFYQTYNGIIYPADPYDMWFQDRALVTSKSFWFNDLGVDNSGTDDLYESKNIYDFILLDYQGVIDWAYSTDIKLNTAYATTAMFYKENDDGTYTLLGYNGSWWLSWTGITTDPSTLSGINNELLHTYSGDQGNRYQLISSSSQTSNGLYYPFDDKIELNPSL